MENNETKLKEFMETIQALDTAVDCKRSLRKLEVGGMSWHMCLRHCVSCNGDMI